MEVEVEADFFVARLFLGALFLGGVRRDDDLGCLGMRMDMDF
jgi:hypothetical protein